MLAQNVFAQSGQQVEKAPVKPVQGTPIETVEPKKTVEVKDKPADIPKPKFLYEYISPRNTFDFLLAIQKGGKRGFRIEQITAVPGGSDDVNGAFAGVMKFYGETQYEYDFIFAENVDNPEQALNSSGKNGWYLRDVLATSGDNGSSGMLGNLFVLSNIYLLERATNDSQPVNDYKLIKAAAGTGRNSTLRMQTLLDAAISEGYVPVGSYRVQNVKSLFSVDSAFCLIVQKSSVERKLEYKFVNSGRSKGLREDIEILSKQGYRVKLITYNSAVLARGTGQTAPVLYDWNETDKKVYPANLATMAAKKKSYVFGGIDVISNADYIKTILVFEDGETGNAFNYQTVKMSPKIPKQFKKNPEEYLKTIENPQVAFERFLTEGYIARDIFYSEVDGTTILFERREKN
ncbi:MAG: hypothetical protein H7Z37_11310 [Pyrinomonadaceae bacterium]|nr:hypothetical protein [Pyrinomonadaceae bacterium]